MLAVYSLHGTQITYSRKRHRVIWRRRGHDQTLGKFFPNLSFRGKSQWLPCSRHQSAWATITKDHRRGDLNDRNLFSHNSGSSKSKTTVSTGWCLLRPSPWFSGNHPLSLSSQGLPSVGICFPISYWVRAPP